MEYKQEDIVLYKGVEFLYHAKSNIKGRVILYSNSMDSLYKVEEHLDGVDRYYLGHIYDKPFIRVLREDIVLVPIVECNRSYIGLLRK